MPAKSGRVGESAAERAIPTTPTDTTPTADGKRQRLVGLVLLVVVPLGLRLWPIEHGLPANYLPDTHVVRNALGMARDRDPLPPAGRYSTYPYLLPYLLLPVYVGEYAVGRAAGEWSGVDEFGRRLLEEPARAHLPARWLVALMAAAAPWLVLRAGRAMGLAVGAWVAAYLVATGLLHVQFSVQERPWAPLVTLMALAAWPAALYVGSGRALHLHLAGLAAALAFACHQAGLVTLGIVGLAWLWGPAGWRGAELRGRLRAGVACVLLFGVLALAVGYPYTLVHGATDPGAVSGGAPGGEATSLTIGGQRMVFSFRPATLAKLSRAFVGYDPVLLVLALVGIAPLLRRRAARPALVVALGWAAVFLTGQGDHTRYLLPLAVLLAWPAGRAAELLWPRPAARAALLMALALPLVQALRLGVLLRREDTRSIAAGLLASDYADAPLAIDVHGPQLPLDRSSLEGLAGWRELRARERHRLALFEAGAEPPGGAGFDAVPLQAILDVDERSRSSWVEPAQAALLGDDPNDVLAALGRRYLLVVDRTPDDGRPPMLLDDAPPTIGADGRARPKMAPVRVVGEPLLRVHPAGEGGRVADAGLPTELAFPLVQLWQLERPGPLLMLYRLPD